VLPGPRELAPGADHLDVKLQTTTSTGVKVEQTLTFHRGSYVIDVAYQIVNAGPTPLSPYAYFQFTRDAKTTEPQSSMTPASFTGPAIYNETDKFKKIEFSDIDKLAADPSRKLPYTKTTDNGWVGMVEHYFVAAWLPPDDKKAQREFYTRKLENGLYTAGRHHPGGNDRAKCNGRSAGSAVRRSARTGCSGEARERASIWSSTTAFSPSSRRRCSGC
jgi:YidC/Oxa1 family membrane protein insertase